MGRIGRTLLVIAMFVLVTSTILRNIGFEMALVWSLGVSVVLTLVLDATGPLLARRRQ